MRKYLIENPTFESDKYDVLNSDYSSECKYKLEEVVYELSNIGEYVRKKIHHPYTPIMDFNTELNKKIAQFEETRIKLQDEVDKYNKAIRDLKTLKDDLLNDNKLIAHFEIENDVKYWEEANNKLIEKNKNIDKIKKELSKYNEDLNQLNAQKKNIKIADKLINHSLRYILFSRNRLELKVDNDKYILYSNGAPVRPDKVSVGERNIIALCYFFTEMMSNRDYKDRYKEKSIVIIDDPVSSFDFENKVGIMSFLRYITLSILKDNEESQIAIFSHDIQCIYDYDKIAKEINDKLNNSCKVNPSLKELSNKKLDTFSVKNNRYSEMLKEVYEYAIGKNEGYEDAIGNIIRRLLEAFSHFTYKANIENVSTKEEILNSMKDKELKVYYANLMYRLVLNGESHMKERINTMQDIDYVSFISKEDKHRVAKDVICFIYELNPIHVKEHLSKEQNAEKTIKKWIEEMKEMCRDDISQSA